MARTYWREIEGGWEFLGAFRDGYEVKDKKQPQALGGVVDIPELTIEEVLERLQVESRETPPMLVGLPTAISKRLSARIPVVMPWSQLEGLVK